jgi:hypothetical protein
MTDVPVWWTAGPDDLVEVDLPEDQRTLIIRAFIEWGGPTRPTDAVARAMGFASREAIHSEGKRIRAALAEHEPMSKRDWARALVATEFVFASYYYGAAGDWEDVTPWTDEQTLLVLRALQRSLGGLRAPTRPMLDREEDPLAT